MAKLWHIGLDLPGPGGVAVGIAIDRLPLGQGQLQVAIRGRRFAGIRIGVRHLPVLVEQTHAHQSGLVVDQDTGMGAEFAIALS